MEGESDMFQSCLDEQPVQSSTTESSTTTTFSTDHTQSAGGLYSFLPAGWGAGGPTTSPPIEQNVYSDISVDGTHSDDGEREDSKLQEEEITSSCNVEEKEAAGWILPEKAVEIETHHTNETTAHTSTTTTSTLISKVKKKKTLCYKKM